MKTPPGHAMTAQAGAVAAHNPYQRAYVAAYATMAPAAQLKPLLAAIDDLREQARAFSETAAVPVEALEGLVDAIRPVASMPLEEYAAFDNAPDNKCIFGANDWNLTVGDIRRLRAALANIERLIKERSNG